MIGLFNMTRRNLRLFFKDKGMFFSTLITPIILLVLYATFLANIYRDSFASALPEGVVIPDELLNGTVVCQLISSLLAVCCVTVSFCANLIMIGDKANKSISDFTSKTKTSEKPDEINASSKFASTNQEYNYDKYSTTFNNLNGQPMYKKNFYMFYDLEKGELQRIQCKVRIGNEEEQEVEEMKNIKITGELPEKITDIPEGCKVYAVGLGDINDLMQKPVLVENYSKKEDKSDEN